MKKITILIFTAAAMASGCKRFTDINQNQNQPTSVTPNVVLSAALTSSASTVGVDQQNLNEWMGYWSRSGNYIAVVSTEEYQTTTGYADGTFQDYYNTMSKYNYIEQTALQSTATLAFYAGVAKTMKALHYSNLINMFGNVPYSQAFNINKYPTPAYDDAATIYSSLITQLDSAVYYFGVATAYYAGASGAVKTTDDKYDIMFGRGAGSSPALRMFKWTVLANTIKLKLLMTEAAVTGASSTISSEIAKSLANGGFLQAGEIASINPGYGAANQAQVSPFYGSFYQNNGSPTTNQNFFRANNYAINFYSSTGDTYRPVLVYAPVTGTTVAGNFDGDPNSLSNSFTSAIGSGLLVGPSQDQLVFSDFESLFLQAEAAARGYNVGATAASLLQQAVEQNFIWVGDNAADADTYLASDPTNPDVSYTYSVAHPPAAGSATFPPDATPGLEAIITQKWIALNGINWIDAWTDYRRTGFPLKDVLSVSHAQQQITNGGKVEIPFRYLYPASEVSTNGKNIPALANGQYTPIFWDKREN